tara:strand:- start:852 stop:1001 length:150 start_codon:yes stop_codon:yes gene_type:complete
MTKKILLSPTRLTPGQYKWLRSEQERTGNPMAAIVRNLIQDQLEKKGKL